MSSHMIIQTVSFGVNTKAEKDTLLSLLVQLTELLRRYYGICHAPKHPQVLYNWFNSPLESYGVFHSIALVDEILIR